VLNSDSTDSLSDAGMLSFIRFDAFE